MVAAGRQRAALLMQALFKYQKTTSRIAFRDLDAMLSLFALANAISADREKLRSKVRDRNPTTVRGQMR